MREWKTEKERERETGERERESWVVQEQFPEKNRVPRSRPPGQLQARMTHPQRAEFHEEAHCLVKNTVALREG